MLNFVFCLSVPGIIKKIGISSDALRHVLACCIQTYYKFFWKYKMQCKKVPESIKIGSHVVKELRIPSPNPIFLLKYFLLVFFFFSFSSNTVQTPCLFWYHDIYFLLLVNFLVSKITIMPFFVKKKIKDIVATYAWVKYPASSR